VLLLVATDGILAAVFDLAMALRWCSSHTASRGCGVSCRPTVDLVGDVSFPIYLVQFAVIISLESWLVTVWNARHAGTAWLPLIG